MAQLERVDRLRTLRKYEQQGCDERNGRVMVRVSDRRVQAAGRQQRLEGRRDERYALSAGDTTGPRPRIDVRFYRGRDARGCGADGAFEVSVFPGPSHTVVASIWPFATNSVTVNVAANDTVIAPIELTPLPTVSLTVTVLDDGTEVPLENADVELPVPHQ